MENKALGKGLEALLSKNVVVGGLDKTISAHPVQDNVDAKEQQSLGELVHDIPVVDIAPGKYQPRTRFDDKYLFELKESIRQSGIIQPLVVRKTIDSFEIIAGERRYRAAKLLEMEKVPCIIKNVSDSDALKIALIENIQRQDLNPIEEAKAYKQLTDEFELTQEKVAQAVGKERATVANLMRLLKLPLEIQSYVSRGTISMGHARALLAVSDEQYQLYLCNIIIKKSWTVRQIEDKIKDVAVVKINKQKNNNMNDGVFVKEYVNELQQVLGTKVHIRNNKKNKGKIIIEYYSNDDFERIIQKFRG